MKKHIKSLSLLIVIFMILQMLTVGVLANDVSVAAVSGTGYDSADDVQYVVKDGYRLNWGAREEIATFLSTYALNFYAGDSAFAEVSKLSGGTSQTNAPSSALYAELKDIMTSAHTTKTSYGDLRYKFQYTDCVQNNYNGGVSCFYTGKFYGPSWDQGATWNREHCWPKSKTSYTSVSNSSINEATDIMSLRPTASSTNSSRGNKAYGESTGYYFPNVGTNDVRGDCARIVLYVYVRWGNTSNMWGTGGVMENLNVLLKWMEQDPVDTWEMGRNDSVQSITGTRNIFVDYPEYAFLLFGAEVPEDMYTPSGIASGGDLPTPPPVNPGQGGNSGGNTGSESTTVVIPESAKLQCGTKYVTDQAYTHTSSSGTQKQQLCMTTDKASAATFDIIKNSDDSYSFKTGGKFLSADGNHVKLVSAEDANTKFVFENTSGGVFIKCKTANYNGNPQYLEVYGSGTGYLTCFGMQSANANIYTFTFADVVGGSTGGGNEGETTKPEDNTTKPEDNTTPVTPPVSGGEETKVTLDVPKYAKDNGYNVGDNATKYTNWVIDSNITMTIGGGNNSGKVYTEGVRIYATDTPAGSVTLKASEGSVIKSVKFTLVDGGTYAFLQLNGKTVTNGQVVEIDASTVTFNAVKNGSDGKQVRIVAVEVVYASESVGGGDIGGGDGEETSTEKPTEKPTETPTTAPSEGETTEKPSTPSGEGLVVGKGYNVGMNQTAANKVVYLIGGMDGYYMATSTDKTAALEFFVEETTGGYYLYTMVNGVKTYVNMVVSGTHVNGEYSANASTVYTYNATLKTLVATVNGTEYAFGTRSDKTYTTIGPVKTELDPFIVFFSAVDGGTEGPGEGGQPGDGEEGTTEKPSTPSGEGLVAGKGYNVGMNQTAANKVVYLIGGMDGYYMATGTDKTAALEFFVEETTGGYYLYTMINGVKTYVNMVVSGTHVNGAYEATPSTVYTYNETLKTLVATVNGAEYAFGTRSDKTYTTIGPVKTELDPFIVFFSAVDGGTEGPGEGEKPDDGEEGTTEDPTTEDPTTDEPSTEPTEDPTEDPTTEPTEEPSTEEPSTDAPTTEAPSEEKTTTENKTTADGETNKSGGCGSTVGGISAIVIAIALPLLFYKKKKENE